jgi:uncharacterized FlgJ-related protein
MNVNKLEYKLIKEKNSFELFIDGKSVSQYFNSRNQHIPYSFFKNSRGSLQVNANVFTFSLSNYREVMDEIYEIVYE